MEYYWITPASGSTERACVKADNAEAACRIAKDHLGECTAKPLPYPAGWQLNFTDADFCMTPEACQGQRCCPRNPTCVE
jgi:hypothetical protein